VIGLRFFDNEWMKSHHGTLKNSFIIGIWIGSLISTLFLLLGFSKLNPVFFGWIFWISILLCTRHHKSNFHEDSAFLKSLKIISVLFLFVIPVYLLIVVSISPFSFRFNPTDPINFYAVDFWISQKYSNEIFPQSNESINHLINDCKNDDPNTKLNKIFQWEMRDWHNPDWEPGTFWSAREFPTYMFYKGNMSKLFANREYELTIFKQKNPEGKFYGEDPYWLAYNKAGACQELSNLFSFMAKKAGVKSRTVQTIWHQWVEVEIDNQTMYYDPWCAVYHGYYDVNDENLSLSYRWFNSTEYFEENCHSYTLFMNWYDEYPYGWATLDYDSSFISHHIKNKFHIRTEN